MSSIWQIMWSQCGSRHEEARSCRKIQISLSFQCSKSHLNWPNLKHFSKELYISMKKLNYFRVNLLQRKKSYLVCYILSLIYVWLIQGCILRWVHTRAETENAPRNREGKESGALEGAFLWELLWWTVSQSQILMIILKKKIRAYGLVQGCLCRV